MSAPPGYARLPVTVHTAPADQEATLNALAVAGGREYSKQLLRVDATGMELEDLTPYLLGGTTGQPLTVSRSCVDECAGKVGFSISKALRWGLDRVQPLALVRSRFLDGGVWHAFPRGQFVVTSPGGPNLDQGGVYVATGYELAYLLQSQPEVSYSFAAGSTYLAAVTAVFRDSGVLAAAAALSTICTYPGTWASKTLAAPLSYPAGSGSSRIQVVNALLKASGMLPVFNDPTTARWTIQATPTPETQPLVRVVQASAVPGLSAVTLAATGWPQRKMALWSKQTYSGDVYNAPNRWIFIQAGLTFKPIEGSGQYTVNNTTFPPSDQTTVGRVVTKVQTLEASGQADLKTQGDAIVTADKASVEKITIDTAPWPSAGHLDVFQFYHANLPGSPLRRVQAQSWTLPLDGSPMTWQTNVVAPV